MGFVSSSLELLLAAYILVGSTGWGYILLRMGWPNIRTVDLESKSGYSVIIGIFFGGAIVFLSGAVTLLQLTEMGFAELLFLNTIIFFVMGTSILTLKRKLFHATKAKVSIPKRAVTANIIAKKAVKKIPAKSYRKVSVRVEKSLSEIRTKLEEMKKQSDASKKAKDEKTGISELEKIVPQKEITLSVEKSMPKIEETVEPEIEIRKAEKPPSKKMAEILNRLEEKQKQKNDPQVFTREKLQQNVDASKDYVMRNIKEEMQSGVEDDDEMSDLVKMERELEAAQKSSKKTLPKSTRLLEQLLKESEKD